MYPTLFRRRRVSRLPLLSVLPVLLLIFAGCATDTGNVGKDRAGRITNVALTHAANDAVKIATSALLNEASSGFSSDFGNSLAEGTYSNLGNIITPASLEDYANAWNPAAPAVNSQLAGLVSAAHPQTSAEVQAVSTTVVAAAQAVSNGIPAKQAIEEAVTAGAGVLAAGGVPGTGASAGTAAK